MRKTGHMGSMSCERSKTITPWVDAHAACEVARQGRRVAQVQIRCWQDEAGHPGRTREIALGRAHFLLGAVPGP